MAEAIQDADRSKGVETPVDPWRLHQTSFEPSQRARDESLFALANGSLGVRGGFEEDDSPSDGSFLAAVFEKNPIHYHERLAGFARSTDTRVPVAEGKGIGLWLGGQRVRLDQAQWLQFERSLDLRRGALDRRLRIKTAEGHTIEIRAQRVVPLTQSALLAIRFSVTSLDYEGPLTLVSFIEGGRQAVEQGDDPRIGVSGGQGMETFGLHADALGARLSQRAAGSGIELSCGQAHRIATHDLAYAQAEAQGTRVEQHFKGSLRPGRTVTVEKFVAYVVDNDAAARAVRLRETLAEAAKAGFDQLAAGQAQALEDFWRHAELSIDGDPASEQALRFNLFHLLQSAGRNGIDGTAAKGLTGEGYEGHCFWDTEAFVLPVMAFTAPEVARDMLLYRFRTLDAARAHAREMNHTVGALYPWRTIDGGECSAHYPSGSAAYHINAAIAYGIGLYLESSDDLAFLSEAGAEMLFETARIWPQVGHFNARRGGAFCIHEVTGPDEYTTLVNNNYYTNRMAQRHLRCAVAAWRWLSGERPQRMQELSARLRLDAQEVELWQRAADAMYLPYDATLGIFEQDDGFLDKPRWPLPLHAGEQEGGPQREHRPLLLDYHPLTLYRHQVCKQADVVMALVLAGDDIEPARKRRSFDYYETVTTHDSTLSAPVFGILAGEVGHADKAWRYFHDSLRVDLDDLHRNTDHGVHMAAMAGSWLGLVQGFGGLRVRESQLHFAPRVPQAWNGYGFNLRWRGRSLRVEVSPEGATYVLGDGDPLTIHHAGDALELQVGQPRTLALPASPAEHEPVFPRPCHALIFDLDGVLTDTAHSHYRAWKRLADEIGVPFDLRTNERLKGVDRAASLDIILESATATFTIEEKLEMAERKNGYYVAEIGGFGPQDLFPGVGELLDAARAAGIKLGLASASRNAAALLRKLGIEDRFDYIADAALIARAKPDPEIFLTVARELGVAPERCIGVEDAAAGIVAIHAAGMPAIGIGDARVLDQADAVLPAIAALRLEDFVST
ncbi:MAG: beta-phosphoglucomutase [Pseudoxanthomonas sp.]